MPKSKKNFDGDEKRKTPRTEVQESFALSVVIPNKMGMVRIYMRDISPRGLCFRSEMATDFSVGQIFDLRLYTNPVFYLTLPSRVVRATGGEIAFEFTDPNGKAANAVAKLLDFFAAAFEASSG